MNLTIPLTGTVITESPLSGDPNDPVRPIDIDLGNVSWKMVYVDLENEVAIIEVEPAEGVDEDTGQVDGKGRPIHKRIQATEQERKGFLQYAQDLVMNHTKDELYQMSKCPRLKRPFKVE